MKIIHFADLHYCRETASLVAKSLDAIEREASKGVDLFAFSGDMFDHSIANSDEGGLPFLQERIRRLRSFAPIVFVPGTITHDPPGAYDALVRAEGGYGMTEILPSQTYFYSPRMVETKRGTTATMLILGCPEPSKRWMLAGKSMSKDGAEAAVQDAMRNLILGWQLARAEHQDLPCIFLLHGQVAGAVLQNNMTLRRGGLQFSVEALRSIGADYYALGDIHMGQQIPGLPAYYPGSAFAKDWGETDLKCFNVVDPTLEPMARVQHIPYGHKQLRVVDYEYTGDEGQFSMPIDEAFVTKYRITNTSGKPIPKTLESGPAGGGAIEVIEKKIETLRAEGIRQAKQLREKITVWALNGGQDIPKGALAKADQLEAEAVDSGTVSRLRYRLKWVKTRGAIGTWKGQRKDEDELILDDLEPGLVALVGESGIGKTTLLENCTPFPNMLTRIGTLQQHFRLRDSRRELCFEDEATATIYRILMLIDGANKTGSVQYFLFANTGDGEKPITNERKEDYEEKIKALFGSQELFVRGAFCPQSTRRTPDLSQATKGEKRELFRDLGGLDYLQAHADRASGEEKNQRAILSEVMAGIASTQAQLAGLPDMENRRHFEAGALAGAATSLSMLEPQEQESAKKLEGLQEAVRKNKTLSDQVDALHLRYTALKEGHEKDVARLAEIEKQLAAEPDARKTVKRYDELHAQEVIYVEKETENLRERERVAAENRKRADGYAEVDRKRAAAEKEITSKLAALDIEAVGLKKDREKLGGFINAQEDRCPTCKRPWDEHTREMLATERRGWELEYRRAGERLEAIEKERKVIAPAKESPVEEARQGDTELPKFQDADALYRVRAEMVDLKIANVRALLEKLTDLIKEKAVIADRRVTRKDEGTKISEQAKILRAQIDPAADEAAIKAKEEHDKLAADVAAKKKEVAECEATLRVIDGELAKLRELEAKIAPKEAEAAALQAECDEWAWLERACGPEGVQALELDAMGPGIADTANRLLHAAYGTRFTVSFPTTRIGGKGKNTRQIEDFQIMVHDAWDDDVAPFEMKSGGEMVELRRAIYDAFMIEREKRTGVTFRTVIMDEADGALSSDRRRRYFAMLEAAHAESNRHHTLIITHSPEAQEMIQQKIQIRRNPA